MTLGLLLFLVAFIGVISVLAIWVMRTDKNRLYVKNEIVKRLGDYADKDYLITNSLIKEARKTLKSGSDFEVFFKPKVPGRWEHNPYAMTGDASCDVVIGGTNVYEQEVLEGFGEITEGVLREHPEIKEWLRWNDGIPEAFIIQAKHEFEPSLTTRCSGAHSREVKSDP